MSDSSWQSQATWMSASCIYHPSLNWAMHPENIHLEHDHTFSWSWHFFHCNPYLLALLVRNLQNFLFKGSTNLNQSFRTDFVIDKPRYQRLHLHHTCSYSQMPYCSSIFQFFESMYGSSIIFIYSTNAMTSSPQVRDSVLQDDSIQRSFIFKHHRLFPNLSQSTRILHCDDFCCAGHNKKIDVQLQGPGPFDHLYYSQQRFLILLFENTQESLAL